MSFQDEKYYGIIFDFLINKGKLTDIEVQNVLRDSYFNLNKIGGNKKLACLFPNCNTIGVESSHLFAKAFLKNFSENGTFFSKSFYPNISESNFNYSIEELGISEVMTFPGFCSKCEQKFSFEKEKRFSTVADYFLQLFRTICYEKRILEIEILRNEKILNRIHESSTNKVKPIFNATGGQLTLVKGANKIEKFFKYQNETLLEQLNAINKLYEKLVRAYNRKLSMKVVTLRFGRCLPLFASYVGNIKFRFHDQQIQSNFTLNIHPINKNETELFFIDFGKKINESHFSKFTDEDFISLFAEIMACSNDWIVKKSYWKTLSDETRREILRNRKLVASARPGSCPTASTI